jgi:DNA adenine methylase
MNSEKWLERSAMMPLFTRLVRNGNIERSGKTYKTQKLYNQPNVSQTIINRSRESMIRMNELFKKCEILNGDFLKATSKAKKGDFIFIDPPYIEDKLIYNIQRETSETLWKRVKQEMDRLTTIDVKVMITSSEHTLIEKLFKEYHREYVVRNRVMNNEGMQDKTTTDVIIMNY